MNYNPERVDDLGMDDCAEPLLVAIVPKDIAKDAAERFDNGVDDYFTFLCDAVVSVLHETLDLPVATSVEVMVTGEAIAQGLFGEREDWTARAEGEIQRMHAECADHWRPAPDGWVIGLEFEALEGDVLGHYFGWALGPNCRSTPLRGFLVPSGAIDLIQGYVERLTAKAPRAAA